MSFEMLNWTSHIIALVLVFLLCLPTFWMVKLLRPFEVHKKIDAAKVKTIRVFENNTEREATGLEKQQLVDWYNEASFIQKRAYENPRVGKEGIVLELDSGDEILIVPREEDFDITQRRSNQQVVTYWARHSELGSFLAKLEG
ncbi:YfmQ family protein [Effusibacillus lacus]|uniref:Uncharacterized protein n=1 Tax=Effusibacillus lacus TaxID=1348429 RepID=A0A292YRW3_9BACL|nr:YfmQ family protein [Effusibacillus lacus]TCS76867.1 uncharacterized protein YfmQ [Effusibacillus lacus]GAX91200.1 hypothetical protein EFBL_2866 [Effusibacillus lacus]